MPDASQQVWVNKQFFCRDCAVVEELHLQLKELQEEVYRLQSTQTHEQDIDQLLSEMLHSQDSLESGTYIVAKKQVDSESCRGISQRTVSQGSNEDEGWKQVMAHATRKVPPPSQNLHSRNGTLCNRYEALESEGQTTDEVGKNPTGIVGCPKTTLPVPLITTSSVKRKRRRVLIGQSLLRGTEGLMCRPDTTHREICCLPGEIGDITGKLSSLIRSSDYYPLQVVRTNSNKIKKEKSNSNQKRLQAPGMIGRRDQEHRKSFPPFLAENFQLSLFCDTVFFLLLFSLLHLSNKLRD